MSTTADVDSLSMANDGCRQVERRSPDMVMRLERLGSLHQSRLSFMRILTRRMQQDNWTFTQTQFQVNDNGVGHAVYTATTPEHAYSLIAFSHELADELRSDRVIAEAWDATFVLFDGIPSAEDIHRLSLNVPRQEAGRLSQTELTLSRANRSVRLWKHVVDSLANGLQPELEQIHSVGYLMRTTAVYGSGKFGAADRQMISDRAEFEPPFQVEMLTVYLIRTFVRDLVQHMANCKGGDKAVLLDVDIARQLGIGNSTGLGMAPFIVNHPQLFNNWIMVREEALARVRSLQRASDAQTEQFVAMLSRACHSFEHWHTEHPLQQQKLITLRNDMRKLQTHIATVDLHNDQPWHRLYNWAEANLSIDGQECLVSLMLEPHADLVDGMSCCMSSADESDFRIDGSMPVSELESLIESHYAWALTLDWTQKNHCARLWYVSEEKLEPRLGERFEEPIKNYEQPLAPARDAALLYESLKVYSKDALTAQFLLDHPEHRQATRRAQLVGNAPYAEIRDNTISATLMPIDMLRCKLSFFGATNFDPRSDRWVRICLYANAPYPEELADGEADQWVYPKLCSSV
ncbi:MAG: hypothetical protein AB8B79_07300 [Granulosicoccus sp.]